MGRRWLFAVVCAAALVAYARSFTVPFQFDDIEQIVENPAVRDPTLAGLLGRARTRLLPYATFVLNYRLGGENPVGYHVVNFAVHVLNCFLVFRLAVALCRTPRLAGTRLAADGSIVAVCAAFLFACHPIQIQAVTYVVQRTTSLAAAFYVGAVLAYVTARSRQVAGSAGSGRAYAMALLLALAAYLSKENAATLPLAILLAEWTFYRGQSTRRSIARWVPFVLLLVSAALLWLLYWQPPRGAAVAAKSGWLERLLHAASPAADVSPLQYFLTQCVVVPRYLRLVFLPWGFNLDHEVAIAHAVSPAVIGGFVLLAALFAVGLYATRRWPLAGFGILWFFLTLAVESSVLPISDPMMEHRMYLPMVGVSLVLGGGFAAAYRRAPRFAPGVALVAGVVLVVLTVARNEVWRSPLSLWTDALAKSPGKARPHINVGTILHQNGKVDEAIPYYCKALELDPGNRVARSNLNLALEDQLDRALEDDNLGDGLELMLDAEGGIQRLVPKDPCAGQAEAVQ
jgi:hypothetical protein